MSNAAVAAPLLKERRKWAILEARSGSKTRCFGGCPAELGIYLKTAPIPFMVLLSLSLMLAGCQDALGDLLEEARLWDTQNVTASAQGSGASRSIVVTWEEAKNAVGYYVFRSTVRDDDNYTQIANVTRPSAVPGTYVAVPTAYTDQYPGPPATYYYKVQAYSRAGSSANNTSKLSGPSAPVNW
jgi:hypothetical protein